MYLLLMRLNTRDVEKCLSQDERSEAYPKGRKVTWTTTNFQTELGLRRRCTVCVCTKDVPVITMMGTEP